MGRVEDYLSNSMQHMTNWAHVTKFNTHIPYTYIHYLDNWYNSILFKDDWRVIDNFDNQNRVWNRSVNGLRHDH